MASKLTKNSVLKDVGPGQIQTIPAEQLVRAKEYSLNAEAQRPVNAGRMKNMAGDNWLPSLLGTIFVSKRTSPEGPKYWVIDGAHRVQATYLTEPSYEMNCLVWTDLTDEQERELFVLLNDERVTVGPAIKFHARVLNREQPHEAIDEMMAETFGFNMRVGLAEGRDDLTPFRPVDAVMDYCVTLAEKNGRDPVEFVHDVMDVMTRAWGDYRKDLVKGYLVKGVANFLVYPKRKMPTKACSAGTIIKNASITNGEAVAFIKSIGQPDAVLELAKSRHARVGTGSSMPGPVGTLLAVMYNKKTK